MAVLAAAQLLDELMGRHRNSNPNEKIKKPNWEDPEVGLSNVSPYTYALITSIFFLYIMCYCKQRF